MNSFHLSFCCSCEIQSSGKGWLVLREFCTYRYNYDVIYIISWVNLVISPRTHEGLFDYSMVGSDGVKADMKRSSSAPMISEMAEAGIRPQFDHPRVYCANALSNLTVDTGVASASRPLVCVLTVIDAYSVMHFNVDLCARVLHHR